MGWDLKTVAKIFLFFMLVLFSEIRDAFALGAFILLVRRW